MKLVLLPAFDGTGRMFQEFTQALGEDVRAVPVAYPESGSQDYDTLTEYVLGRLPPDEDFVLLGESFAGPIVYRVARRRPANCKALVFVATYLTNPRPWVLKIMTLFPARLIAFFITRPWVVRLVSLSKAAEQRVARAIAENFAATAPNVIKQRLQTISGENDKPTADVVLPCLYIQAESDRLVLPKKLPDFQARCASLEVAMIQGGHFVLQENPVGGAGVVRRYLKELVG